MHAARRAGTRWPGTRYVSHSGVGFAGELLDQQAGMILGSLLSR